MNSHWPYNICVILLQSMQTFAGLRDSSLSDPCLSVAHYGTTEVTINCQSVYGKTEYYSQCGKTIWPRYHTGAYVYHDYRPALQAQSRPPIRSIIVSYCVQSVWIQWITEFRVTLLLNSVWDSRVGLAGVWLGRSCSQLISLDSSYSTCELKQNFNSKVSLRYQGLQLSATVWCRIQSFKSTASTYTLTTPTMPTHHAHPDWTIYASTTATTD